MTMVFKDLLDQLVPLVYKDSKVLVVKLEAPEFPVPKENADNLVFLADKVLVVPKVLLELLVKLVLPVDRALLVLLVPLVKKVVLVQEVNLVPLVEMVLLVHLDSPDHKAQLVNLEILVMRENQEDPAKKDTRDPKEIKVLQVPLVIKVLVDNPVLLEMTVLLVQEAHKVLWERKVNKVNVVTVVNKDALVCKVFLVLQDPKVKVETLDQWVAKDRKEVKDNLVPREQTARLVFLVLADNLVKQATKENLVNVDNLVQPEPVVLEVLKVTSALVVKMVLLVLRVHLVPWVLLAKMEPKDMLVLPVCPVTAVLLELLVSQELMVLKVNLVMMAVLVKLVDLV